MTSFISILILLTLSVQALCCTGFLKRNSNGMTVLGKNFDWTYGHGQMITNKRNVQKFARGNGVGTDRPLIWMSKYGSLTFNQLGREFPYGGMNEKGLIIEILWLDKTEYQQEVPGVQSVDVTQWVQSMLDRAATIDEVVTLTQDIQVRSRYGKVHFFVCESSGHCIVMEYLNKSLFVTRLEERKDLRVLTNDPYKLSKDRLKEYEDFGGNRVMPSAKDNSSLSRFVKIASRLQSPEDWTPLVKTAFEALDSVTVPGETKWTTVYDPSNLKIFFKTSSHPDLKEVNLKYFDWSCATSVKILDLNTRQKGEVSSDFENYSDDLNKEMVEKNLFIPKEVFPKIEAVPSTDHCS